MKWVFQLWVGICIGAFCVAGCASSKTLKPQRRLDLSTTSPTDALRSVSSDKLSTSSMESQASNPAFNPAGATEQAPTLRVARIEEADLNGQVISVAGHTMEESLSANVEDASVQSDGLNPADQSSTANSLGVPVNLPTALAMIGGQHPVVGFAQWRVQEAYAQLDRANVMWLPTIQSGFNYRRHDGNYQAVDGSIVDVNLNSMNYGLGTGAVAAGSPTRPGLMAQFHLADAIFLPKAAEKTAWARGHAAAATLNQQLLSGAIAYMDLLEAYQDLVIIDEAVQRTADLDKITGDFAEAGEGLQADADRTATELTLLKNRQLAARERQLVASTRLARALSIPMTSNLLPQDAVAVPLNLQPELSDEPALITTGLSTRPELKESQALVAAACEAYKRERVAPFVPSVLLGFSTSSFGGGLGNNAANFGGRYDVDALMVWEMRNFGLGEAAAKRERNAQVHQATFAKLRMMDQVAQEVAEAHAQVQIRQQQIETTQAAITRARDSYTRNIDRIRDAKGLPIEALQSIQALEATQRAYLRAVVDSNRAQLQLQWALGWPIHCANPLADGR